MWKTGMKELFKTLNFVLSSACAATWIIAKGDTLLDPSYFVVTIISVFWARSTMKDKTFHKWLFFAIFLNGCAVVGVNMESCPLPYASWSWWGTLFGLLILVFVVAVGTYVFFATPIPMMLGILYSFAKAVWSGEPPPERGGRPYDQR